MRKSGLILMCIGFLLILGALSWGASSVIYETLVVTGTTVDTDDTLAANSDLVVPSQKAIKTYADTKQTLDADLTAIAAVSAAKGYMLYYNSGWTALVDGTQNYIFGMGASSVPGYYWLLDTDGDLAENSDTRVASQKAVKAYADTKAAGPGSTTDGYIPLWSGTLGLVLQAGVELDTDGALTADSDTKVASQKAVKTYADTKAEGPGSTTDGYIPLWSGTLGLVLQAGVELDTDGALTADSDTKIASQKAVKTYADTKVPIVERIAWKTAMSTLTATECGGYIIIFTNTSTRATLPAGSLGMKVLIQTDTDHQVAIRPDASNKIKLVSGILSAGTGIKNTSVTKTGDYITLIHNTTNTWDARYNKVGTWETE